MSCHTIRTVQLEMKNLDLQLLESALKALGQTVYKYTKESKILQWGNNEWYNQETGLMTTSSETFALAVKRQYSAELVMSVAQQYGLSVEQEGDEINIQYVQGGY